MTHRILSQVRGDTLSPQRVKKSLAEFRRPQAAEENEIVFPAACTAEKHFARSERRRTHQGPRRKRSESPLAEKAAAFFDSLRPPRRGGLFRLDK